jgi:hypothetical protein
MNANLAMTDMTPKGSVAARVPKSGAAQELTYLQVIVMVLAIRTRYFSSLVGSRQDQERA